MISLRPQHQVVAIEIFLTDDGEARVAAKEMDVSEFRQVMVKNNWDFDQLCSTVFLRPKDSEDPDKIQYTLEVV